WGEDPLDVGGEKLLHLSYVRCYFSLPFRLEDLGLERGLTPPNLVHFWEFLLACWARAVGMDPLPVFHRPRFVGPVLGLSAMSLLIRPLFAPPRKSALVYFGVLVLCLCEIVLQADSLRWVRQTDPPRGLFAFRGTAPHAAPAMDVLLP